MAQPEKHGDGCDDAMDRALDEATPYLVEFVTDEKGRRVPLKVPNPAFKETPRPRFPPK